MSSITLNLDDIKFKDLVEEARELIPSLAPQWTDFNVHDPGVMLIELLAFTAEAQIYSLGRLRRDERAAYAALLGVRPRGPQPASGIIWPNFAARFDNLFPGMSLPAQTVVTADRGPGPLCTTTDSMWIHAAPITRVLALTRDGARMDNTQTNLRHGASFPILGPAPQRGDGLVVELGAYVPPTLEPAVPTPLVALGFRVIDEILAAQRSDVLARFRAMLRWGQHSQPLRIHADTTLGLLRSGVMLFEWPEAALVSGAPATLSLELQQGELYPAPYVERVALNALPVVQQQYRTDVFAGRDGAPNQQFVLTYPNVRFGDGAIAPSVGVGDVGNAVWRSETGFRELGPTDQAYRFDAASNSITFGNGINGAIPAPLARITATYWTTEGDAGNRPLGLSWSVPGISAYGVNLDPMSGGAAAETLDDTRRRARSTLGTPLIVTDADLIAAARALAGLQVVRAEILEDSKSADATRTLLVLRRRDALSNSVLIPESQRWLAAVARALRPRLLLGERLRVIGPEYVPVQVSVELLVAAKADPTKVQQQVLQSLPPHFSAYATDLAPTPWAIGEALDVQTIRGWLRALPGVLQVANVTLSGGGTVVSSGSLSLPPRGLPQVSLAATDITIQQTGASR